MAPPKLNLYTVKKAEEGIQAFLLKEMKKKENLKEKDPFFSSRKERAHSFLHLGWPRSDEPKWRNTPLKSWKEESYFSPPLSQKNLKPSQSKKTSFKSNLNEYVQKNSQEQKISKSFLNLIKPTSYCLVFVNGVYKPSLSQSSFSKDIQVIPLSFLLPTTKEGKNQMSEKNTLLSKITSAVETSRDENFTSLNTSLFNDGSVILISKEIHPSSLIHMIYISESQRTKNFKKRNPIEDKKSLLILNPRNFIFLDPEAKTSLMESYLSSSNETAYFNNSVTQVQMGKGSCLNHIRLQKESLKSLHIGQSYFRLEEKATLQSFYLSLGGSLSHYSSDYDLEGSGASANTSGLYSARFPKQHMEQHTFFHHKSPSSISSQLSKGVLNENAVVVFHGRVRMNKIAQKSSSNLLNKNLLLNEKAQVHTQPQMEIQADDVKAAHGATVSQFTPDELLYLRSRGLSQEKAFSLLVKGFISDILKPIESPFEKELHLLLDSLP